jgi:hypothetical protein
LWDQLGSNALGEVLEPSRVAGLQIDDLNFEEARSLTRPAMTSIRGQLRGRLTARLARSHRR